MKSGCDRVSGGGGVGGVGWVGGWVSEWRGWQWVVESVESGKRGSAVGGQGVGAYALPVAEVHICCFCSPDEMNMVFVFPWC